MKPKQLTFDNDARGKLLEGAELIERAVGATLGPRGNNVAIGRDYGAPAVIHDGVTVANHINVGDPYINMGVQLMKEAAAKTNSVAGDGTTTAIVLAHAMVSEAHKNITAGANSMMLRRGMMKAKDAIIEELRSMANPVKSRDEKQSIATISAQDPDIGNMIVNALDKVGDDGIVTVDESQSSELSLEYREGMQFGSGFAHPIFVNDTKHQEAKVDKPIIIIADMDLHDYGQLMPLLEKVIGEMKRNEIVLIANEITGSALEGLALNKTKQNLPIIPIKTPGVGNKRREYLDDIAALTGARVLTNETDQDLSKVNKDDLGTADQIVAGEENTVIVGGQGDPTDRIDYIKEQLDRDLKPGDRENLQERLAKLTKGIAVINVGANTEADMREKKERVIDAIGATKAAIAEGVVPGGETALFLSRLAIPPVMTDEEKTGFRITVDACVYPIKRLLKNAGMEPGDYLSKISKENGVDVEDRKLKDLTKAGVIDPVKVTVSALDNATTVAGTIMTTSVLVAEEEQDEA